MPEVPGSGIENARRCRLQRCPEGVVAKQIARGANIFAGAKLHQLTEQQVRSLERIFGLLPPDIASRQVVQGSFAHGLSVAGCSGSRSGLARGIESLTSTLTHVPRPLDEDCAALTGRPM
jgi:uncharacterized protein YfaQ (DUF2300 family)